MEHTLPALPYALDALADPSDAVRARATALLATCS